MDFIENYLGSRYNCVFIKQNNNFPLSVSIYCSASSGDPSHSSSSSRPAYDRAEATPPPSLERGLRELKGFSADATLPSKQDELRTVLFRVGVVNERGVPKKGFHPGVLPRLSSGDKKKVGLLLLPSFVLSMRAVVGRRGPMISLQGLFRFLAAQLRGLVQDVELVGSGARACLSDEFLLATMDRALGVQRSPREKAEVLSLTKQVCQERDASYCDVDLRCPIAFPPAGANKVLQSVSDLVCQYLLIQFNCANPEYPLSNSPEGIEFVRKHFLLGYRKFVDKGNNFLLITIGDGGQRRFDLKLGQFGRASLFNADGIALRIGRWLIEDLTNPIVPITPGYRNPMECFLPYLQRVIIAQNAKQLDEYALDSLISRITRGGHIRDRALLQHLWKLRLSSLTRNFAPSIISHHEQDPVAALFYAVNARSSLLEADIEDLSNHQIRALEKGLRCSVQQVLNSKTEDSAQPTPWVILSRSYAAEEIDLPFLRDLLTLCMALSYATQRLTQQPLANASIDLITVLGSQRMNVVWQGKRRRHHLWLPTDSSAAYGRILKRIAAFGEESNEKDLLRHFLPFIHHHLGLLSPSKRSQQARPETVRALEAAGLSARAVERMVEQTLRLRCGPHGYLFSLSLLALQGRVSPSPLLNRRIALLIPESLLALRSPQTLALAITSLRRYCLAGSGSVALAEIVEELRALTNGDSSSFNFESFYKSLFKKGTPETLRILREKYDTSAYSFLPVRVLTDQVTTQPLRSYGVWSRLHRIRPLTPDAETEADLLLRVLSKLRKTEGPQVPLIRREVKAFLRKNFIGRICACLARPYSGTLFPLAQQLLVLSVRHSLWNGAPNRGELRQMVVDALLTHQGSHLREARPLLDQLCQLSSSPEVAEVVDLLVRNNQLQEAIHLLEGREGLPRMAKDLLGRWQSPAFEGHPSIGIAVDRLLGGSEPYLAWELFQRYLIVAPRQGARHQAILHRLCTIGESPALEICWRQVLSGQGLIEENPSWFFMLLEAHSSPSVVKKLKVSPRALAKLQESFRGLVDNRRSKGAKRQEIAKLLRSGDCCGLVPAGVTLERYFPERLATQKKAAPAKAERNEPGSRSRPAIEQISSVISASTKAGGALLQGKEGIIVQNLRENAGAYVTSGWRFWDLVTHLARSGSEPLILEAWALIERLGSGAKRDQKVLVRLLNATAEANQPCVKIFLDLGNRKVNPNLVDYELQLVLHLTRQFSAFSPSVTAQHRERGPVYRLHQLATHLRGKKKPNAMQKVERTLIQMAEIRSKCKSNPYFASEFDQMVLLAQQYKFRQFSLNVQVTALVNNELMSPAVELISQALSSKRRAALPILDKREILRAFTSFCRAAYRSKGEYWVGFPLGLMQPHSFVRTDFQKVFQPREYQHLIFMLRARRLVGGLQEQNPNTLHAELLELQKNPQRLSSLEHTKETVEALVNFGRAHVMASAYEFPFLGSREASRHFLDFARANLTGNAGAFYQHVESGALAAFQSILERPGYHNALRQRLSQQLGGELMKLLVSSMGNPAAPEGHQRSSILFHYYLAVMETGDHSATLRMQRELVVMITALQNQVRKKTHPLASRMLLSTAALLITDGAVFRQGGTRSKVVPSQQEIESALTQMLVILSTLVGAYSNFPDWRATCASRLELFEHLTRQATNVMIRTRLFHPRGRNGKEMNERALFGYDLLFCGLEIQDRAVLSGLKNYIAQLKGRVPFDDTIDEVVRKLEKRLVGLKTKRVAVARLAPVTGRVSVALRACGRFTEGLGARHSRVTLLAVVTILACHVGKAWMLPNDLP